MKSFTPDTDQNYTQKNTVTNNFNVIKHMRFITHTQTIACKHIYANTNINTTLILKYIIRNYK